MVEDDHIVHVGLQNVSGLILSHFWFLVVSHYSSATLNPFR